MSVLEDKNKTKRFWAVMALGNIGDARAVDPLLIALNDEDRNVRSEAARALGKLKNKRASFPLLKTLQDKEPWIRAQAAFALGEIKETNAVLPLIELIKNGKNVERQFAMDALEKIGAPATSRMLSYLENKDLVFIAKAYPYYIRLGEPGSESPLIAALNKYGSHDMAINFVYSGNQQLAKAGHAWANKQGFGIIPSQSSTWVDSIIVN